MSHSTRNRKLIFGLMFAMIGMRLLIFALGIAGIIEWTPPASASMLSWVLPVGMPLVMITVMLLLGRKRMEVHPQMQQDSDSMPLSEILKERLACGEITGGQYEEMKRILRKEDDLCFVD